MAVGRNRNKIYAIAVACFWIAVFVTVFTLPYLYYSANLGPKTGFVYTGLCVITWSYVYFCVGEVHGRSFEEIDGFFRNGIPARHWRTQPRLTAANLGEKTVPDSAAQSNVDREEKAGEPVATWEEVKN
jgi:MFS transporter, SP family, sugar:H+ symporter